MTKLKSNIYQAVVLIAIFGSAIMITLALHGCSDPTQDIKPEVEIGQLERDKDDETEREITIDTTKD